MKTFTQAERDKQVANNAICCKKCGEWKKKHQFTPSVTGRYGIAYTCKKCANDYRALIKTKDVEQLAFKRKNKELMLVGERICRACNEQKPLDDFYFFMDKGCYYSICKKCRNVQLQEYYINANLREKRKAKRNKNPPKTL